MRYYDLTLTDPTTGKVLRRWTSFPNGAFDGGALNIMFDLPVSVGALPAGNATITVEGISLAELNNAQNWAAVVTDGQPSGGVNLTLKGGMGSGLPLANPKQQGVLVQGTVFQSWGTWVGTDMSISFVVVPTVYSYSGPGNIVLSWTKGTSLQSALQATLSTAYPGVPVTFQISPDLIAARDDVGYYHTFNQLAQHIEQATVGTLSSTYKGVQMVSDSGSIFVFDGTQPPQSEKQLQIYDFVGQPAWVQPGTVQVKTVLRGDIAIGDTIKFPQGFQGGPGSVQTTAQSYPGQYQYKSAIQGSFLVQQIRHLGNFRDANGGSWATIMNCTTNG